jgi:hypothetical protein
MLIAGRVLVLLALLYAASCSAWGCSAPAFAPGLQHAGPTSRVVQGRRTCRIMGGPLHLRPGKMFVTLFALS